MAIQDSLTKIETRTVVEQIIEKIIHAISQGDLPLGEKIPNEYELIETFGVSRNSLREAMKILHAMGIVRVKRGDGTYVCSQFDPSLMDTLIYGMIFDLSDKAELIEFRESLDTMILNLAVVKATEKDIQDLEENLKQFKKHLQQGDYAQAAECDFAFHMKLCEATYNNFIIRISKTVYRLYFNSIEQNIVQESNFANADVYHGKMLDCIKARDISQVKEVIELSLSSWQEKV